MKHNTYKTVTVLVCTMLLAGCSYGSSTEDPSSIDSDSQSHKVTSTQKVTDQSDGEDDNGKSADSKNNENSSKVNSLSGSKSQSKTTSEPQSGSNTSGSTTTVKPKLGRIGYVDEQGHLIKANLPSDYLTNPDVLRVLTDQWVNHSVDKYTIANSDYKLMKIDFTKFMKAYFTKTNDEFVYIILTNQEPKRTVSGNKISIAYKGLLVKVPYIKASDARSTAQKFVAVGVKSLSSGERALSTFTFTFTNKNGKNLTNLVVTNGK